nr:hypothetical protein CFP56_00304 [Quercus suber]
MGFIVGAETPDDVTRGWQLQKNPITVQNWRCRVQMWWSLDKETNTPTMLLSLLTTFSELDTSLSYGRADIGLVICASSGFPRLPSGGWDRR